jgi:hypothetical protein
MSVARFSATRSGATRKVGGESATSSTPPSKRRVDEIPHRQQLALHRRIERVELLGTVERDRGDRVGDLVGDRRERHRRRVS